MNRAKSAAVLTLVGAFAAGVGTPIVYNAVVANRPKAPDCPQPRSANTYSQRFAEFLELSPAQKVALDSLLDVRTRAVSEIYAVPRARSESLSAATRAANDSIWAVPRAKADSIRKAIGAQQNAVFTPAQRAILEERQATYRERDKERQAQRQAQQARCEQLQPRQPAAQNKAPQSKNKSNH